MKKLALTLALMLSVLLAGCESGGYTYSTPYEPGTPEYRLYRQQQQHEAQHRRARDQYLYEHPTYWPVE